MDCVCIIEINWKNGRYNTALLIYYNLERSDFGHLNYIFSIKGHQEYLNASSSVFKMTSMTELICFLLWVCIIFYFIAFHLNSVIPLFLLSYSCIVRESHLLPGTHLTWHRHLLPTTLLSSYLLLCLHSTGATEHRTVCRLMLSGWILDGCCHPQLGSAWKFKPTISQFKQTPLSHLTHCALSPREYFLA